MKHLAPTGMGMNNALSLDINADQPEEESNILIELGLIEKPVESKVNWCILKPQNTFVEDRSSEGFKSFTHRFLKSHRLFYDFANIALKRGGEMIPLEEKDDDFFDLDEEYDRITAERKGQGHHRQNDTLNTTFFEKKNLKDKANKEMAKVRKAYKNKKTYKHVLQDIIEKRTVELALMNESMAKTMKTTASKISKKDELKRAEENDNPQENDAIYTIVEFLKNLGNRKSYIQYKKMFEYCKYTVDEEFTRKITGKDYGPLAEFNQLSLRLRLSGEQYPPVLIYKFLLTGNPPEKLPGKTLNFVRNDHLNVKINSKIINFGVNENHNDYSYHLRDKIDDNIKFYNSKENYYRYAFQNGIYVQTYGNLIKRNDKKVVKPKPSMPFDVIQKIESNLDCFNVYRNAKVNSRMYRYIDPKRKKYSSTPLPRVTLSKAINFKVTEQDYIQIKHPIFKREIDKTNRIKNMIIADKENEYENDITCNQDLIDRHAEEDKKIKENKQFERVSYAKSKFIYYYKLKWKRIMTPKCVKNNKCIKQKMSFNY